MSSGSIVIEAMLLGDWEEVRHIYLEGIATKNATFETNVPSFEMWDKAHRPDCRLVARINNKIAGWAALSSVSTRKVYLGVAESSVYIGEAYRGQGIGDKLMEVLIKESEANGVWTLQVGIFPENKASIHLHEKHGFRVLGKREKVGKMDDWWRDVVLMERRSSVVGNE
jgi:L-amino acid N-acyltransferase YncA